MKAFESIRIERADNGFTMSVHYPSIPGKKTKSNPYPSSNYVEPDKTVHEDAASVLRTLTTLINGKPISKKKSSVMNKIASATADRY